jgi:hypothetical protein
VRASSASTRAVVRVLIVLSEVTVFIRRKRVQRLEAYGVKR